MRGLPIMAAASVLLLSTCDWRQQDDDFTERDWEVIGQMVLPPLAPQDAVRAQLGQQLFFDTELSGTIVASHDGQPVPLTGLKGTVVDAGPDGGTLDGGLVVLATGRVACADCHLPDSWFSDDRSSPNNVSLGVQWTGRNSPSLVNVGYYQGTFAWDGRGDSLLMQSAIAYTSGRTMAGSPFLLSKVALAKYADAFADAGFPLTAAGVYGEDGGAGPQVDAIASFAYGSLAAYLMRLGSMNAPIDRFAAGDRSALSEPARRGLQLFIGKAGCVECHSGPAFTDNGYHNTGIAQRGEHVPSTDNGRSDGITVLRGSALRSCLLGDDAGARACPTPDAGYTGLFRTKSLRQVAKTAPYMHAGQLATLADVVQFYQVGGDPGGFAGTRSPVLVPLELTPGEANDLVAFLEALTGEGVPAELRCDSSRSGGVKRYPRCAVIP